MTVPGPRRPRRRLDRQRTGSGWSALAVAATLWPGLGTADPDAYLPDGFAADRLGFTLTGLLPLAAVAAAAAVVAHYGRRQKRSAIEAAAAPGNGDESPRSCESGRCPDQREN